jgi:hypothetical protein
MRVKPNNEKRRWHGEETATSDRPTTSSTTLRLLPGRMNPEQFAND